MRVSPKSQGGASCPPSLLGPLSPPLVRSLECASHCSPPQGLCCISSLAWSTPESTPSTCQAGPHLPCEACSQSLCDGDLFHPIPVPGPLTTVSCPSLLLPLHVLHALFVHDTGVYGSRCGEGVCPSAWAGPGP